MSPRRFLLVSVGGETCIWKEAVADAVKPFAELTIVSPVRGGELMHSTRYDLIIVDTLDMENVLGLIRRIKIAQADTPIVVATDIPSWRQAREVFREGVVDYITKGLNLREIASSLKSALAKFPRNLSEDSSQ